MDAKMEIVEDADVGPAAPAADALANHLEDLLEKLHGFRGLYAHQLDSLRSVLVDKKDTLLVAATNSGKSAIFHLIGVNANKGCVLIITPTLELQKSQMLELAPVLSKSWPELHAVSMGTAEADDQAALSGRARYVFITPERACLESDALLALDQKGLLLAVVYDECHLAADSGWVTFRPAYDGLRAVLRQFTCPILAMTATCPVCDVAAVSNRAGLRDPMILRCSSARPNIKYTVLSQTNIEADLLFVVEHLRQKKDALVFVPSRKLTAEIYRVFERLLPEMCTNGDVSILPLHSSLSPEHRSDVLTRWKAGTIRLLIATSVLSNGVHKDGVSLIAHWGMSTSMTEYVQQCGRGGRGAALPACDAVAFVTPSAMVHQIRTQSTNASRSKVNVEQLQAAQNGFHVASYCSTTMCRHKWQAIFMGDSPDNVGGTGSCCDNCVYKASDPDGKTHVNFGYEVSALLQTVLETGGRYSFSSLVAINKGPARMPKSVQHIQRIGDCSTFGSMHKRTGVSRSTRELLALCHATLSAEPPLFSQPEAGLEKSGGISLTQAGRALLRDQAFTPKRSDFSGTFLIRKPAVMLPVKKRPSKATASTAVIVRAKHLELAINYRIQSLAIEHKLSKSHILPSHCFGLLAAMPLGSITTSDQLSAVPDVFGAIFDAFPELWAPFCAELLRLVNLPPSELAPALILEAASAAPAVAKPAAPKPKKRQRSRKAQTVDSDKENIKPTPKLGAKKSKSLHDPEFVPMQERARQETFSNKHGRLLLAFGSASSTSKSSSTPPMVSVCLQLAPAASRPTRTSALVSSLAMEEMAARKRKSPEAGALASQEVPKKGRVLGAAVPLVASCVLDEILKDCKGDAKQFHELLWGNRAVRASVVLGPSEDEKLVRRLKPDFRAIECGSGGDCMYRSFVHQVQQRPPAQLPADCKGVLPTSARVKMICLTWLADRPRPTIVSFYLPALLAVYPKVPQRPMLYSAGSSASAFKTGWRAYLEVLYGPVTQFADELILVALAESFKIRILVWSSQGDKNDRNYSPSATEPCGSVQLGHIFEAHYKSVVKNG